jgi:NAD(P)H-dependent flavin oxidoreductase YrpB (nitropropane dioxygenase family)
MLRTALCDVLGIDVPIILAAMGGTASSAEFAAAASNEGALGSIASLFRTNTAIKRLFRTGGESSRQLSAVISFVSSEVF